MNAAKRRLARRAIDAKRRGSGDGRRDGEPLYVDPQTIFEIHRLFATITAGSDDRRFADLLAELSGGWPLIQTSLIYWVDLIEVLVQTTEARYTPGSGPQKKDEVKAIVMFIVRTNRIDLPASIPSYLRPVVVDVAADVAVDAIVALFNDQVRIDPTTSPWVPPPARPSLSQRRRQAIGRLLHFLGWLLSPLARIASRIYLALRYPVRISPGLKRALAAIEQDSALMRERDTADDLAMLLRTIHANADALKAGVELLGIVVREVEQFSGLSGREKKVYARQLAFAVLEDLGVDTRGPVTSVKLGLAIDTGIELVVHLFNKRAVFEHGAAQQRLTVPRRG